jgi:hypothetical protein
MHPDAFPKAGKDRDGAAIQSGSGIPIQGSLYRRRIKSGTAIIWSVGPDRNDDQARHQGYDRMGAPGQLQKGTDLIWLVPALPKK